MPDLPGNPIVRFPRKPTRRLIERARIARFGLRRPGYILRLPHEVESSLEWQWFVVRLLRSLADRLEDRLLQRARPLTLREFGDFVASSAVSIEAERQRHSGQQTC